MSHPTHPVDLLILEGAKRERGFTCQPLGGLSGKRVYRRCDLLAKAGKLHKAKISHHVVRWYDTAERAQAAMDKVHTEHARRVAYASAAKPRMQDQGPAIVPAGVKAVVCPPFVPRFQVSGSIQFGLQRGRVTR